MVDHLEHRADRARFGIVRAIYETLDTGMHQRASAHCTRFNCSKQGAVAQAVVAEGGSGVAERYDLGMRRRIVCPDVLVPSAAYDLAFEDDDSANWNLSGIEGALGGTEGFLHPEFVGGHGQSRNRANFYEVIVRDGRGTGGLNRASRPVFQ
jgi:hypothetical protein